MDEDAEGEVSDLDDIEQGAMAVKVDPGSEGTALVLANDVMTLTAEVRRLRELHYERTKLTEQVIARAEAAEARVAELEQFVSATDLGDVRSRCLKAVERLKAAEECANESEAYEVEYLTRGKVSETTRTRYARALAAWRKAKNYA